jgi:hypothetical protein
LLKNKKGMNEAPILLRIASYCDMKTLLNFMIVNKKCYSVFKYIVRNAPTVFIAMYVVETGGTLPKKVIYKSLKELFTELHQYHLNNPKYLTSYPGGKQVKDCGNLSGPCFDCMKDPDFEWCIEWCMCDDISYTGIKMVKYLSNESSEEKEKMNHCLENSWSCKLKPLSDQIKGFRISMRLNNLYNPAELKTVNYKSMEYLYFGIKKFSFLFKNGIRKRCPDKMKYSPMHYPATTDILPFLDFVYLPKGKANFNKHHGMCIIDESDYKIRINKANYKIRINTI